MPLYEYACTVCGKHTEKRQKFSDPEITECPFCGNLLKRVITAPAFSFQGGGWYKDGYGNAPPPAAANKTESTAKTEGSTERPTEQTTSSASPGESAGTAASPASAPATPAATPASAPATGTAKASD